MKKLFFSVGDNIKLQDIGDFIENVQNDLDNGEVNFAGAIWVYRSDIKDQLRRALKDAVNYLCDAGMILDVYFSQKSISTNVLDVVRNCERFNFISGAMAFKSLDGLSETHNEIGLNRDSRKERLIEEIRSLNYLDYKKDLSVGNQRSGMYFGMDTTALAEDCLSEGLDISNYRILGDVSEFNRIRGYREAMNDSEIVMSAGIVRS